MRSLRKQLMDELLFLLNTPKFVVRGACRVLVIIPLQFGANQRRQSTLRLSESLINQLRSQQQIQDNCEIFTMGVPFEALLPYGIMLAMFGITGAGLSGMRALQNGGKRARHSVDAWDRVMMDRDRRLTGFLRGQTDNPSAPLGFELNNPWRLEKRII
ncbi:hypothetical protein sscle_03g028110 [Sclerotinia sclerotiorum 1980 UF-70]|uniref:NADH dehydrogenase [ubiquinone] 1 alpha subcomplex subunit 1 n=1 Tax=Sclerotinia sclerotiorum (strain ATCC 18683 / 1980 / Ss-1) TaxID=665079 RepID=A0A1D9PZD0_SCLS1|nr:hypothetical protein sscle_03g028110 [Sclerotinia sclerotiorum 1980 UF-70]